MIYLLIGYDRGDPTKFNFYKIQILLRHFRDSFLRWMGISAYFIFKFHMYLFRRRLRLVRREIGEALLHSIEVVSDIAEEIEKLNERRGE